MKDIDYSVPYEVNPYQADIDKLSTLGIDNVKPKVYNNSTYKVNDKEVSLTAEDKVKYTKMAGEMYIEKTAKIFKSNLSDEQKAKKIAEINKQIDKKIKEMMMLILYGREYVYQTYFDSFWGMRGLSPRRC